MAVAVKAHSSIAPVETLVWREKVHSATCQSTIA